MDSNGRAAAQQSLEQLLRDLPRVGSLVKDRGYRQVWRFEHDGRAYYLKFYPRGGVRDRWRRRLRGSPARREFERLQALQRASIPAPRAVAMLVGLRINDRKGDAVVLHAIEPAVQLDHYLNDLQLRGEPVPDRLKLAEQVRSIVYNLGRAKLGHEDLHLGNFLLHDGKVYLLDAYAVRPGGMRMAHLLQLGHSVSRFATTTDLLRGWNQLGPGGPMPKTNSIAGRRYDTFTGKASGPNRYFGRLTAGNWSGVFFRAAKYPRRWSRFSQMTFDEKEWTDAWPALLARIESDQFEVLKRTRSGDVLAGEIVIGGRPLDVIVKHPKHRYWYRYFNEIFRGSRPRRAWFKAWDLVARNLPTAWPLLLMERRAMGYVTDALIVFERVPGPTLHHADLDAIEPAQRDMLFRRTGRLLRKIDNFGLAHTDGKATNFIVRNDDRLGPYPVLVDVDGIRRRPAPALGIERLLRSLKKHAQYTVADSLALCRGYAPYARLAQEGAGPAENQTHDPPDSPDDDDEDSDARDTAVTASHSSPR